MLGRGPVADREQWRHVGEGLFGGDHVLRETARIEERAQHRVPRLVIEAKSRGEVELLVHGQRAASNSPMPWLSIADSGEYILTGKSTCGESTPAPRVLMASCS